MRRLVGSNASITAQPAGSRPWRALALALVAALSVTGGCKRDASQTPANPAPTSESGEPASPSAPSTTTTNPPAKTATTQPAAADAEPAALTPFTIPEVNTDGLSALIRTEIAGARAEARTSPAAASAIARLGALCYVHADPRVAVACFERAAALEPNNDKWPMFTALAQAKAQDQRAALATCEKVLARNPEAPLPKVRMAEILSATDRSRAQALYEQALQEGLDTPYVHFGLAQCLRAAGQREEAIEHLRQTLAQAPGFAEAHGALATLLREAGTAEEAAVHEQQQALYAQFLSPMDPFKLEILFAGRDARTAAHQAFVSARVGNAQRARSLAERALQVDRTARLARHALALTHLLERRPEEAAAGLRELLQEDPDDLWAKSDLGEALLQLRQYDDAEKTAPRGPCHLADGCPHFAPPCPVGADSR